MDSKISIIKRNLDIANSSASLSGRISVGQAEELALLNSGRSVPLSQVSRIFKSVFPAPLLSVEYFKFCKGLLHNSSVEEPQFHDIYKENSTVSYLKNNYSEEAFIRFHSLLGAKAETVTDFNSVCESVYSGNSDYAIIPLFNTNDGLMVSLYRMLQRYELKAVLSTEVMMGDGMTETKFMLLSKRRSVHKDFSRILVTYTDDVDSTLPGLLTVCSAEGIKVKFINTLPLEYTDDRLEVILDIDVSECDKNAVLLFLKTALPDINIIGMYKTVK